LQAARNAVTPLRVIRMANENRVEAAKRRSEPVRLGLVGAGPAGRRRVDQIMAETGVRLSVVHDLDRAAAQACADHTGATPALDAAAVFEACEAVVIATPLQARADLVRAALEAGCSVLTEGLPAGARSQLDELYVMAAAGSAQLIAGRAEPGAMALALSARDGEPPRLVEVARSSPSTQRRSEVGVCLDLMVDDIEAVCALMRQPPVEVRANVSAGRGERADAIEATVRFRGGAIARLRASRLGAERSHVIRITGRDGMIEGDLVTGNFKGGSPDLGSRIAQMARAIADGRALLTEGDPGRPYGRPAMLLALQIEGVCRAQAL
jgi:predicted dehydrogenase